MILLNISEDEKKCPTPIETCCIAMFKEITDYLQKNNTSLKCIYVVSPVEGVVQAFGEQMKTDACVHI